MNSRALEHPDSIWSKWSSLLPIAALALFLLAQTTGELVRVIPRDSVTLEIEGARHAAPAPCEG